MRSVTATAVPAADVDYLKQVKPLLAARCGVCHGALAQKAKLRLDTAAAVRTGGRSGPAVVPGKSGESLLIQMVTAPPSSLPDPLSPPQAAAVRVRAAAAAPAASLRPDRGWMRMDSCPFVRFMPV